VHKELCFGEFELIMDDYIYCNHFLVNKHLEKTEGAFKNGQSRDIGNIRHKKQNEDKQKK